MANTNNMNVVEEPVEMKPYRNQLRITGAWILPGNFRNFIGEDRYGSGRGETQPYFTVDLSRSRRIEVGSEEFGWRDATIEDLIDYGWRVKEGLPNPNDPDAEPSWRLKVNLGFDSMYTKPKVKSYTPDSDMPTELTKETVGVLDKAFIEKANLILNPSKRRIPGDGMRSAYVVVAHFHIRNTNRSASFDDWE